MPLPAAMSIPKGTTETGLHRPPGKWHDPRECMADRAHARPKPPNSI